VVANSSDKPPAAFPTHLIDKKTVAAFPTHLIDRKTVVGIAGRYGIPASRMGQIAEATGKGDAAVLNNLTPEEKQAHMEFLNYAGSIPEIREQLMLANPEVQAGQSALNVSNNTILGVANEKVLNTSQGVADKINQSVLARPAVIADIHSEASKKLGISASDPNWKPISDKFGSLDKLIQGYQDGTITDEILAKSGLNEQQLAMINQLKVSSDMAIDQRSEHFFSKASLSGDGKAALDKLCKETNLTPAELRSNMRSRGTFLKQTKDIHASIGRGDPAKGEQLLKDIAGKEAAYNALKNIDWKRWVEVIGGVLAAVGGMFSWCSFGFNGVI
jgi:hypothetical protein